MIASRWLLGIRRRKPASLELAANDEIRIMRSSGVMGGCNGEMGPDCQDASQGAKIAGIGPDTKSQTNSSGFPNCEL